jgi:hypothetical protein
VVRRLAAADLLPWPRSVPAAVVRLLLVPIPASECCRVVPRSETLREGAAEGTAEEAAEAQGAAQGASPVNLALAVLLIVATCRSCMFG